MLLLGVVRISQVVSSVSEWEFPGAVAVVCSFALKHRAGGGFSRA